ncbi:MAG: metalloregulator ArsR/SmtB family transcription factor [Bacteroidota bacterium]|nr:metalloregulator ArsR/SmtB family transcription factor [Bacteroidota bacterium]
MDDTVLLFRALADPNRLRIVTLLLAAGELCVCDIQRVLHLPQPRVSRHLGILQNAGVVTSTRRGRWMHYTLCKGNPLARAVFRILEKTAEENPQYRKDRVSLQRCDEARCRGVTT